MESGTIRNIPLLSLIAMAVLVAGCGRNAAGTGEFDWPRWRGPNGDGVSQESGWNPRALAAGARVLWRADVGSGYSGVAIRDGRLYTLGLDTVRTTVALRCLDAATGKAIWRRELPSGHGEPQSTPTVDGERVYGLTRDGLIVCLRTANGELLWKKDLGSDFHATTTDHGWAASPIVEGDLLLLNANTLGLALDKETGDLVWTVEDTLSSAVCGSFATAVTGGFPDGRYALFLGKGTLSAVQVTTGKKLWSIPHGNIWHPVADPIVSGNRVFLQQDEDCFLLELTAAGPDIIWRNTSLCHALPTAVLVDGHLYCSHLPPEESDIDFDNWSLMRKLALPFRCVDWNTGEVVWEKSMQSVSVTAAGSTLILLELGGTLRIIEASASGYEELSSADVLGGADRPRVFATPAVLCNRKIYCRNFAGDLICVDVRI